VWITMPRSHGRGRPGLGLIVAFDRREGWKPAGAASCVHWLALRCDLAERTARAHLSVGHALRALPGVRRLFAAGRLSYAKIRALCPRA